jgi:hypothetical protein
MPHIGDNNVDVEAIAVGVLTGVLNGVDRLISEPFWTHYETKVVASRLLGSKYWKESPLENLGEIFTEALGKPISRKLRIKKDDFLYYNFNSRISSKSDDDVSLWSLVKEDYITSDNGSIKFERKIFPASGPNKRRRALHVTIFKKKPEYADIAYGDSCIVAEALLDDDTSTNPVIFSVTGATGEFEKVVAIESVTEADNKRKIVLKYNGEI